MPEPPLIHNFFSIYTQGDSFLGKAPRRRARGVYLRIHEHARRAATQPRIEARRVYIKERIANSDDPRSTGKPLHGELTGLWRYRIGNYRVICQIIDKEIVVLVVKVGHRKNVY